METDDRFKHLVSDPRFKNLRKKQRKVQIDERFQSMFTDERFTLKYKQDKRGRKQKKTSGDDLKRYYSLDTSKEEHDDKEDEDIGGDDLEESNLHEASKSDDEEEDGHQDSKSEEASANIMDSEEQDEDSSEEEDVSDSELSTSSDEPESEDDDLAGEGDLGPDVEINKIQYDWQPLDHDAERADTVTRRIAIQNLDWNHLDVKDVYTLVNSIRPPLSVRVYVSEFGKERLAKEEVEGPQELAEMPQLEEEEEEFNMLEERMQALQSKGSKNGKTLKADEYEDADEIKDSKNEEIRERLRRYQLSQMKYYYAIAEFDSPESAQAVYKELDGIEYEGSSLELDLRFVPDDMEFDPADIKAECNKVPDLATYKAPQFISSALQQTTVNFTWDETDIKRQEKLNKAYTKEELEKDDLEAYLASETDSEDEELDDGGDKSETMTIMTGNTEARVNKYRQLLRSLDEEAEKKKKVDVDIEWGDYEGDEKQIASNDTDEVDECEDDDEDGDSMYDANETGSSVDGDEDEDEAVSEDAGSDEDNSLDRRTMKKGQKLSERENRKDKKRDKKGKKRKNETEPELDADLDLLVMDVYERQQEDFKFNPDDDRFKAVYESGLYNIDPSHPNFKRTEAFNQIAERKREKRRKTSS